MMPKKTDQQSTSNSSAVLLIIIFAFMFHHPVIVLAAGKKITLMDRGLNMPITQLSIPSGWKVIQDIATDPNSGETLRQKFELYGPRGQVIRNLPIAHYFAMMGQSAEQLWLKMAESALQDVDIENYSDPHPNGPLVTLIRGNKKEMAYLKGQGVNEFLEFDFKGSRNNKPCEGKGFIGHGRGEGHGFIIMIIYISKPSQVMQTAKINNDISESAKQNPQYAKVKGQMNQRAMQNRNAKHKARMGANQAQFEAHQKKMQGIYDSNDRQNQQWMNNFRNDGYKNPANNGYSGHDSTIDSINETSTFSDPYSGQNVTRDGQYRYNYTDGLGGYYGTNDPSFNPNSLPGNWQKTEPLRPNY